jgi:uncharacterized protein affecting Mg2+/Co2+ transport
MHKVEFNPALVGINVVTTYLPSHSQPEEERYTFAYTITISNGGDVPVQLLSRHWIITDADNDVQPLYQRGDPDHPGGVYGGQLLYGGARTDGTGPGRPAHL